MPHDKQHPQHEDHSHRGTQLSSYLRTQALDPELSQSLPVLQPSPVLLCRGLRLSCRLLLHR